MGQLFVDLAVLISGHFYPVYTQTFQTVWGLWVRVGLWKSTYLLMKKLINQSCPGLTNCHRWGYFIHSWERVISFTTTSRGVVTFFYMNWVNIFSMSSYFFHIFEKNLEAGSISAHASPVVWCGGLYDLGLINSRLLDRGPSSSCLSGRWNGAGRCKSVCGSWLRKSQSGLRGLGWTQSFSRRSIFSHFESVCLFPEPFT